MGEEMKTPSRGSGVGIGRGPSAAPGGGPTTGPPPGMRAAWWRGVYGDHLGPDSLWRRCARSGSGRLALLVGGSDQHLVDSDVRRLGDDVEDRPGDVLGPQLPDPLGVALR